MHIGYYYFRIFGIKNPKKKISQAITVFNYKKVRGFGGFGRPYAPARVRVRAFVGGRLVILSRRPGVRAGSSARAGARPAEPERAAASVPAQLLPSQT